MVNVPTYQTLQVLETICKESMEPYKAIYVTPLAYPKLKYRAYTCVPGANYFPGAILEWSESSGMEYTALVLERKDIDSYDFRLTEEYEGLVFTFKGKSYALNVEYDPPTQKLHIGKLLIGSIKYE